MQRRTPQRFASLDLGFMLFLLFCNHVAVIRLRLPCRIMIQYLAMTLVFNQGTSKNAPLWKTRLQHLAQATLRSFSRMIQRHFAVHALLLVSTEAAAHGQWLKNKHFYVGSTTAGIHSRQDARRRKHRCVEQEQWDNLSMWSWLCMIYTLEISCMKLLSCQCFKGK